MCNPDVFANAPPYIFPSRAITSRKRDPAAGVVNERGKLTLKQPVLQCFQDLYAIEPHADVFDFSKLSLGIPAPSTPPLCEELPELGKSSAETSPGVCESIIDYRDHDEYSPHTVMSPDDPDDPRGPRKADTKYVQDLPDTVDAPRQRARPVSVASYQTSSASESLSGSGDLVSLNEYSGMDSSDELEPCYSSPTPVQQSWPGEPLRAQRKLSPMSLVRKDLNALKSGDAIFTVALDQIFSKLVIALNDRASAYLFRDFAGHFSSFLDRFGPGGYDSHRAPPSASWMLKLIMPWMHIDDDACETNVSVYIEVSGWVCRITELIGKENWDVLLEDGPINLCAEQIAYRNADISDTAYKTLKTVVATFPIRYELLCKILLIRNMSFGFDAPEMVFLRHHRLKLLNQFVARIDAEKSRENQREFMDLVDVVMAELADCEQWEHDQGVATSLQQTISYTNTVQRSMEYLDVKDPFPGVNTLSKSPRLSHNVNRYCDPRPLHEDVAVPMSHREKVKGFFKRIFRWNRRGTKDLDQVEILTTRSMPAIQNRFSINSFRVPLDEFCGVGRYGTDPRASMSPCSPQRRASASL